jgi:hypothetical protein
MIQMTGLTLAQLRERYHLFRIVATSIGGKKEDFTPRTDPADAFKFARETFTDAMHERKPFDQIEVIVVTGETIYTVRSMPSAHHSESR